MNKKFKFLTVLLALVMTLGAFAPFSARAEEEKKEGTKTEKTTETVTLHKLIMTKDELAAWDSKKVEENGYNATQDLKGLNEILKKINEKAETVKEIPHVYFVLKFADDYKDKDKQGKFVKKGEDEHTPADPIAATDNIEDAVGGLTTATGFEFKTSKLAGNFIIDEVREKSTYKGEDGKLLAASKAVPTKITLPIVNNAGVVEKAHVYPKNTQEKPKIDKNFSVEEAKKHMTTEEAAKLEAAIEHKVEFDKVKKAYAETEQKYKDAEKAYTAEDKELIKKWGIDLDNNQREKQEITKKIGDDVQYVVETEIPKDAKYKKLVWNDNMTKGLTYNKDLTIVGAGLTADDYTIIATDRGFTLVLKESGLTKVENAAKTADVTIKLTYSAKVNETSIVDTPDLNDIALDYSNIPGKDNEPKEFTPGKKEITMKKTWDITGNQTITEADKNVVAYFTLQKKNDQGEWEDVKTVEKTAKEEFTVVFDNLDENGTYRIVESVKGYEAEYMEYNPATGEIEIKDHKNTDNPEKLNPSEPKVVTGGKKFVKTDENKTKRLAGAEFVVMNSKGMYLVLKQDDGATKIYAAKKALHDAIDKYNGMTKEEQDGAEGQKLKEQIEQLQKDYNKAFKENSRKYDWEAFDSAEDAAKDSKTVVLRSNEQGQFEITGLAYGDYKLVEVVAPKDYAKLNAPVEFKVAKDSYKNGVKDPIDYVEKSGANDAQCVPNKKVTIPQTGGIGTVIFTVVGVMLMVGAAFALKRRKEDELEGLA